MIIAISVITRTGYNEQIRLDLGARYIRFLLICIHFEHSCSERHSWHQALNFELSVKSFLAGEPIDVFLPPTEAIFEFRGKSC